MFNKLKGKEKKTMLEAFMFIVSATQSAAAGGSLPLEIAKAMVKAEPTFVVLKEDHPGIAPGTVFVYATSQGIAASGAPAAPPAAKTTFQLQDGISVPASKRGGGLKGETYPFAQMAVGQSFFVPATEAKPNPAKSLNSTVSSANKRFTSVYPATLGKNKTPNPKAGQSTGMEDRKFVVRARTAADETGQGLSGVAGARIWRVS